MGQDSDIVFPEGALQTVFSIEGPLHGNIKTH